MTKDKFYHFEESHVVGEEKNGESKATPAKVFVGFLVIALAAALIGVVIYYNTGERKTKLDADAEGSVDRQTGSDPTTTLTSFKSTASPATGTAAPSTGTTAAPSTSSTVPPSTDELLQRIDCIPEAKGQNVKVTKELCSRRNCIFDTKNYGTITSPACYFSSEKTGYKASNFQDTGLGFKCDLDLKGQGPFGLDLTHMEFEVQMLGDNILRFKVRTIYVLMYSISSNHNIIAGGVCECVCLVGKGGGRGGKGGAVMKHCSYQSICPSK